MIRLGGLSVIELLDHVDAEPSATLAEAIRRRDVAVDPGELARLYWVIGLSERGLGRLGRSRRALDDALEHAAAARDRTLSANVKMSLSFVVGRLGDLDHALALLEQAEPDLDRQDRARLMNQRGAVLYWRGDLAAAVQTLEAACDEQQRLSDQLGEVRTRVNVGMMLGQLGRYESAAEHLNRAVAVARELGQHVLLATAHQNLGFIAMLRGQLPEALESFELAERGFVEAAANTHLPRLHADHAQALADAALFDDADALLTRAHRMFEAQGNDIEVAGGLVTAAEIRLAQGDFVGAQAAADEAAQWYRKQGRERWVAVATNLALQAAARSDDPDDTLPISLDENADALRDNGLDAEATRARLVAAKLRAESSLDVVGELVTSELRRLASGGRPADRILLASVDAIAAARRGDRAAARRAVSSGLNAAISAQAALGSIETRAHAAVHGFALTELGARLAIEDGRPRELLERIEATRLMTSRMPALRPPDDLEMAAMLTELRRLEGTIADSSSSDDDRDHAEHERVRLERNVRRRSRAVRGDSSAPAGVRDELRSALSMLEDRQLLAHAALDGQLYAVSVVENRARLHDLGPIEGVTERIEGIAFALNRLNRLQGSDASNLAAAEMLYAMADELTELLLPDVIVESMSPVILVPTSVLHDVPWGLLPPLGGRAVSINPSVSAWARANRTRDERHAARTGLRSVGFMAGPGLEFADIEVEHLAAEYIDPEVFTGSEATGAACIDLLGRADLVHIACHGSFRTDNPMFSSLVLADGPLIVHDLERLDRLPEIVVLPACSVATAKALQGGSLLGLATALITLGACNVIAPLTPINDASSVTVMHRLHQELVLGATPAAALASAVMSHDLADPTAAAFITLGA